MSLSAISSSIHGIQRLVRPSVGIAGRGFSSWGRHVCSSGKPFPARHFLQGRARGRSRGFFDSSGQRQSVQSYKPNRVPIKHGSGGNGNNGRRRYEHKQHIPTYVYVAGGLPIVGGFLLYLRFQDFAPLTGRRRWIATHPQTEKSMGDQNYRQLVKQYGNNILPEHHPANQVVERAGRRIFLAARRFAKDNNLTSFDANHVTFTVVNSEQANAFVLPGNHVFVLTGLFKYAKTEDEIAGILGHEMAHNLARHQGERISSSVVVSLLGFASLLIDPSGSLLYWFAPAVRLFGQLPNSRVQEREADQIGMRLAAEACYDPGALSRVCGRMDAAGKNGKDRSLANKPPEFLSTHPSDESRIADMRRWLPEERKRFEMHGGERCREFRRRLDAATRNENGMARPSFLGATHPTGLVGMPCAE